MERSKDWEDERYVFERLKQTQAFKKWKDTQFDCQRGRCAWCGRPMMYNNTETDHISPLYYGGTSDASNLVICCHKCNEEKSTNVGFIRPEWIAENRYDCILNEEYATLKDTLLFGSVYKKAEEIINNHQAEQRKKKSNAVATLFTVLLAPFVIIFLTIVITFLFSGLAELCERINPSNTYYLRLKNSTKTNTNADSKAKLSSIERITTTEEDQLRKTKMQSILSEYNKYYEYWVLKKGYSLPRDASKCGSWNGCSLSFPRGSVEMPDGYTYSISSLVNGVVLSPNGQLPNATKNNIALYKRARCDKDGAVVGGAEAKNAAAVVGLSDGTYYCIQN